MLKKLIPLTLLLSSLIAFAGPEAYVESFSLDDLTECMSDSIAIELKFEGDKRALATEYAIINAYTTEELKEQIKADPSTTATDEEIDAYLAEAELYKEFINSMAPFTQKEKDTLVTIGRECISKAKKS